MSIDSYIEAQRSNLNQFRSLPHFAFLINPLDEIYALSGTLMKPVPRHFSMLLLLCNKSLLSAATLIGQAQPDDAGAITRRASEIGKVAFAIKYDRKNTEEWTKLSARLERWEARGKGQRPKPLPKIDYKNLPKDHAVLNCLETEIGIQSDTHAHFTPEYFHSQPWTVSNEEIHLAFFYQDASQVAYHLLRLADVHALLLQIFDECAEGKLHGNPEWSSRMNALKQAQKKIMTAEQNQRGEEEPTCT